MTESRSLRDVYAEKALAQIPRILGNEDRNPASPTHGCFDRTYWLDRATDFPSAIAQFSVLTLALVYACEFPGNEYFGVAKVRNWAVAGMEYWARIQHADGSFDEFYPYERGWAGPTAFTLYAVLESYDLLKDEIPADAEAVVLAACRKAAGYVARYRQQGGVLANHIAIALAALWRAYEVFGLEELRLAFDEKWRVFLTEAYDVSGGEGWSLEYDGVDPGYLSATISFLGKAVKRMQTGAPSAGPSPAQSPEVLGQLTEVLVASADFASYFVYPDGSYAGTMGSRQTAHFYPHGFEILAGGGPEAVAGAAGGSVAGSMAAADGSDGGSMAAAVAQKMLVALRDGRLVPPEIMADRYLGYRTAEYLEAYLDHAPRPAELPALPCERSDVKQYFAGAKVFVLSDAGRYLVVNLGKGGVIKLFDKSSGRLVLGDCGVLGRLADGTVVTSQWIDARLEVSFTGADTAASVPTTTTTTTTTSSSSTPIELSVAGNLVKVPTKRFNLPRMLLFRAFLLVFGWSTRVSHLLKGGIRKRMMLGATQVGSAFARRIVVADGGVTVEDVVTAGPGERFAALQVGDEFSVRYVPQSLYFQRHELATEGWVAGPDDLERLNGERRLSLRREFPTAE